MSYSIEKNYAIEKQREAVCVESIDIKGSEFARICKFLMFHDEPKIREEILDVLPQRLAQLFSIIIDKPMHHVRYLSDYSNDDYSKLFQCLILFVSMNKKLLYNLRAGYTDMYTNYIINNEQNDYNDILQKYDILCDWVIHVSRNIKNIPTLICGDFKEENRLSLNINVFQ